MRTLDTAGILREISDTMAHWDGTDIAEKACDILRHEVTYIGDGVYQIIEDPVEEQKRILAQGRGQSCGYQGCDYCGVDSKVVDKEE